jgi:hypothetical protein
MVFNSDLVQCDISANVAECGGVYTTPVIVSDFATPIPGTPGRHLFYRSAP